jgi:hypothetical protein
MAGMLTRSRIEAFEQTANQLQQYANQWRAAGATLDHTAGLYVSQMTNPSGTDWRGQAAARALDTAHADRLAVTGAVVHAHDMAAAAERGSNGLLGAREGALQAIADAEADDFTVGEDLSVADNRYHEDPGTYAARLAQAESHLAYIEHHAGLLEAENDRVATQLSAGATQMAGMVPETWQPPKAGPDDTIVGDGDGNKPTIQMVDNHYGPLPGDPPPQPGGAIKVPQRPNAPTVINAEPGVGGNVPAPPPPGFSGASGMTQLRDLSLILGGAATIGLSIPGELVTGGAATVGIIGGGTMVIGGMTELIDGME